jgi:hypothetical protein
MVNNFVDSDSEWGDIYQEIHQGLKHVTSIWIHHGGKHVTSVRMMETFREEKLMLYNSAM